MNNNSGIILDIYNSISSRYSYEELLQYLFLELENKKSEINALHNLSPVEIFELIGIVHQKNKEIEIISKTNVRKHHGIYYTNYVIAKKIIEDLYKDFDLNSININNYTFLEPCSGIGIFCIAYIDYFVINKIIKNNYELNLVIKNMFCSDIDDGALAILKKVIPLYVKRVHGLDTSISDKNIYSGDILFSNGNKIKKINPCQIFNKSYFDVVLTNPPYKLLKANSNKYGHLSTEYKDYVKNLNKYIKQNKLYKYNTGTLNLYKIFIEEIIENYTNDNSRIGLLVPLTLLNDKQSEKLRKYILKSFSISTIFTIPEKNNFFNDISQAFCFFSINKSKSSSHIDIVDRVIGTKDFTKKPTRINKNSLKIISNNFEIINTDRSGFDILKKIHENKTISEFSQIVNLRGELDLSLNKKFISKEKTNYILIKGSNIKAFNFSAGNLYVSNKFIKEKNSKFQYILSPRIICQQISNMNSNIRLKFAKIPENIILGNSCNFISISGSSDFKLDYILGVMNSVLLNWRFKLSSSNNHIANYEINNLPLAIGNKNQNILVEKTVNKLIENDKNINDLVKLNILIFEIYKLNREQAIYVTESLADSIFKNNLLKELEFYDI